MSDDAANVARIYFDAWKANDFDAGRSLVADDVSFEGPLATLEGAEAYMEGIRGLSRIVSEIAIRKVFVDGRAVLTWYDIHTTVAPPMAVANWLHVERGKITALRVAFDARTRPVGFGLPRTCLPRTPVNRP
jgi:ketosteroid isomerase-like protein